MIKVILEPQLVLPPFVPSTPQKKLRNGAMNSIALLTLQKRNCMQPIQHLLKVLTSIYLLYESDTSDERIYKNCCRVIRLELLPALLVSVVPEVACQLYSFLLRHAELGIPMLSEIVESQFEASEDIKLPPVSIMIAQVNTLPNKTEVLR